MPVGTLYLLPIHLGEGAPWPALLPAATQAAACQLTRFIAENAKSARAALKWLEHPSPLREIEIEQLPEPLSREAIEHLLAPLLTGAKCGLLSEAGCPGIADPGALLARRAHELGIPVKPLVGPSSLLLALMASGLEGQRFAFHGYLPAREPERSKRIAVLEMESLQQRQTQLFIETPYRNAALFDAILSCCKPQTLLCVASDLSLPSETVSTHAISEWRNKPRLDLNRRPTVFLLLSAC